MNHGYISLQQLTNPPNSKLFVFGEETINFFSSYIYDTNRCQSRSVFTWLPFILHSAKKKYTRAHPQCGFHIHTCIPFGLICANMRKIAPTHECYETLVQTVQTTFVGYSTQYFIAPGYVLLSLSHRSHDILAIHIVLSLSWSLL